RAPLDGYDAALLEHPSDAVRLAEVAAMARKDEPQLRDHAVAIIREHIGNDRDAAGAIALVNHFLETAAAKLAGAFFDRAVDIVVGHRLCARGGDRRAQARVGIKVAAAKPRRNRDFLDQLGEELAALGIARSLLVLDRTPLGMT